QAAQAAAPVGTPQTPEAKLAAVAAAQAAAKSIPSSPITEDFTLDGLKNASEDDLNRVVLDGKLWGKIGGNSTDDIFL
ncbi:hypothetical protein, partial [Salmonella enterica]|uniref:hypothetical protein n=1 Tax=Salmonella enterica TaxID=28901 RepID=UPI0032986ACB